MPVCEQDFEDGVLQQTRIHLLGARGIEGIITVPATGAASLNWLFYDGHGNLVRTMNTSFALSAFQWRGVWGERTNSTPSRGYCANLGHLEDETGLVYMRARYYEPGTGRFVSEDLARDGVNWYLYADGDPVGKVDGNGQSSLSDFQTLLFYLGSVFAAGALAELYMNWKIPTSTSGGYAQKRCYVWKSTMNGVRWMCRLSIFFFAGAAVGLSDNLDWLLWSLGGIELILDFLITPATQAGLRSTASAAVAATFTYALLLTGFLVAAEIAGQEGR